MVDNRNQTGLATKRNQNMKINSRHKHITLYEQEHVHSQGGRLALDLEGSQRTHLLRHRPPQKRTFSTRARPELEKRGTQFYPLMGSKQNKVTST